MFAVGVAFRGSGIGGSLGIHRIDERVSGGL
jgi:hypothetical protein